MKPVVEGLLFLSGNEGISLEDLVDVLAKMKEICPKDDNGNPTYGVSLFNDWDGNMVMYVKSLYNKGFIDKDDLKKDVTAVDKK